MSDTRGGGTGPMWNGEPEEDAVRSLLGRAGTRRDLPVEALAAIEERAREAWQEQYGAAGRSRRRSRAWMAAAAVVLLAVGGLVWRLRPTPKVTAEPAATVARLSGTVDVEAPGERAFQLSGPGALAKPISPGSEVETTGNSRLALRMARGASVRFDAGSRARMISSELVALERGALYVDTDAPGGSDEVSVRTPAGLFRPRGTQFEVRIEPGGDVTRLRVRKGTVGLETGLGHVAAAAGEQLLVASDGRFSRDGVLPEDSSWSWTLEAAPMLPIEGIAVTRYLDWLSRETGWRVEFADPAASARADSTILHGSIDHLTPVTSPGVVLESCGLGHRFENGAMVVFVARRD